jgi:hypothetical protein
VPQAVKQCVIERIQGPAGHARGRGPELCEAGDHMLHTFAVIENIIRGAQVIADIESIMRQHVPDQPGANVAVLPSLSFAFTLADVRWIQQTL